MICKTCGEDEKTCADVRVALKREPWLPCGFELGAQWTSYDGGITWHRFDAYYLAYFRRHVANTSCACTCDLGWALWKCAFPTVSVDA